ncbi:MAG: acyltransferase family protein [Myxococcota bacterium]
MSVNKTQPSHELGITPGGQRLETIPALDGLRGLAILLVLWHHVPYLFDRTLHAHPFWRWSNGGGVGVDLFFVVSGFLITSLLWKVREEPGGLRRFWVRRALRIFPLYYVVLMVTCGVLWSGWVVPTDGGYPADVWALWPYLVYLGNLQIGLEGYPTGAFNILWSLCIEEQFYLLWPFLVLRLPVRSLVALCQLILLLSPLLRLGILAGVGPVAAHVWTLAHLDPLALGCWVALWRVSGGEQQGGEGWRRWTFLLGLAGLLGYLGGPLSAPGGASLGWLLVGYGVLGGCMTGLLLSSLEREGIWARGLSFRPLGWWGRRCYGLYLWHWLIGMGVVKLTPGWTVWEQVMLWSVLLMLGVELSWRWLEAPLLRLKARWG